jgi:hypothetical protein
MSFILGPDGSAYLVDTGPQPSWDAKEEIGVDFIEETLRNIVEQNRDLERASLVQLLLDRAAEACLVEGETELGLSIGLLNAARVAGQQHIVCECLMQLMLDLKNRTELLERSCRICGCTNDRACPGGCAWVEFDLCSRCA